MCQTKPLHAVKHGSKLSGEELAELFGRHGLRRVALALVVEAHHLGGCVVEVLRLLCVMTLQAQTFFLCCIYVRFYKRVSVASLSGCLSEFNLIVHEARARACANSEAVTGRKATQVEGEDQRFANASV